MRSGRLFGAFSGAFGIAGVLAAISAEYLRSVHDPHDGAVLRFLDKLGLVAHDLSTPASMTAVTVYSINDTNAIIWLYAFATYLGGSALLFSLLAEYHREEKLELSIGFIAASTALTYMNLKAGIAVAIIGFLALLIVRATRGRMPRESQSVGEP